MCIYVQSSLADPVTYLVHKKPARATVLHDSTLKPNSEAFFDFPFGLRPPPPPSPPPPPLPPFIPNGTIASLTAFGGIASAASPPVKSVPLPDVPNLRYADKWSHPSDIVTAYDQTLAANHGLVYMDQTFAIGDATTSAYAKTVEAAPYLAEYTKRGFAGDGEGHMFGYATCHWIRACHEGTERLGSPCNSTLSGVHYKGFCFSSATGSLECGHLTAIDDEYGEHPVAFDARSEPGLSPSQTSTGDARVVSPNLMPFQAGLVPETSATLTLLPSSPGEGPTYRCPTGSPATSLGAFISKRLLIAGCMISSDASYDPLAEVHVPAYCATPADYLKGCLLPSARNFDPLAKQDGRCLFVTKGCTSSTAINYNSEASLDDPDHPCIEIKRGCTVNSASYAGVDPGTPGFRSGYYGSSLRDVGVVSQSMYSGPVTLNYDDLANVNDGCVIAIEGCMDPAAINFDAAANTNSGTWCIPPVRGCMMPSETAANAAYANPAAISTAPHMFGRQPDGLNANFSAVATVHDSTYCVVARYGCGASGAPTQFPGYAVTVSASNYDPSVTVETVCYWPRSGCLNPAALNFGCETSDVTSPCFYEQNITIHVSAACIYSWDIIPSSPSPPQPAFPPGISADTYGVVVTHEVSIRLSVGGTLDFFTEAVKQGALDTFKSATASVELDVALNVTAGSVVMEYIFETQNEALSTTFEQNVRTGLGGTAASAQAVLGDAIGVQVLSSPEVTRTTKFTYAPSGLSPSDRNGIIVGSIGGALLLLCCAHCVRRCRRKPRRPPPRKRYPPSTPVVGVTGRVRVPPGGSDQVNAPSSPQAWAEESPVRPPAQATSQGAPRTRVLAQVHPE